MTNNSTERNINALTGALMRLKSARQLILGNLQAREDAKPVANIVERAIFAATKHTHADYDKGA
jgi:hypothetical protein